MHISHIEHIGIAVRNLEESIAYWENIFGLQCYRTELVQDQHVRTAFFRIGNTKIELLESTSPEGPVQKFINEKGEGIHHIAFAVDKVQEALDEVACKGVQLIDREPRRGAENLLIGFLHPKSTKGVLTEFCSNE